jgi:hypothetical protein
VFLGLQGSTHWDTLPFPGGDTVRSQTVIDSSVFFGTQSTGQVWQLKFPNKTWANLQTGYGAGNAVNFLQPWRGSLTVFLRPLADTIIPTIWGNSGSWSSIGKNWPPNDGATIAFSIDSQLFGGSYSNGLWRRSASDTAWSRVPDAIWPEKYVNDSVYLWHMNTPRALTWYNGNLWVGYLNYPTVYLTGVDTPWHSSKIDSTGLASPRLPISTMTLFVHNGRLFAGGNTPSTPMVYKDGSGWQYLSQNWGRSDNGKTGVCSVDYTFNFAAIGDTLYAAGCGHIFKLPWSLVPQ